MMAIGLLAELMTAYRGRDEDSFSLAEKTPASHFVPHKNGVAGETLPAAEQPVHFGAGLVAASVVNGGLAANGHCKAG